METDGDAWGDALLDHLDGLEAADLWLETHTGMVVPALAPEWFFRAHNEWDAWERDLLARVEGGPVLDLGAGAGRSSLHLQSIGHEVTAIEASPGAAEVCRRRGVQDVRQLDLLEPPADRPWQTVLLLCGNLGLGGTWDGNRRLLRRLGEVCAPDALLLGDSVTVDGPTDLRLRLRYRDVVTPWWSQRNVGAHEVDDLVAATGWSVEHRSVGDGGVDHCVALRHNG